MTISSPAFNQDEPIPLKYTGLGENISPPLVFADIPDETKSFILIVEDQDATPQPWIHWLVFNIPHATHEVAESTIPLGGTEGLANGGTPGYEGPNQVYFKGVHSYNFKLYALDMVLTIPVNSDKHQVLEAATGHIIAEATLTATAEGTGSAL
ncbi:MAG TPA: YbhB/YbcL family Raf kinase inhibitor-like protein [Candidatus Limnocylindrales bacterium]|nr:YbhB/YbcL family Raf kinase inhibitor-like protein [Candidatus Limnocylindrales bacterium]